MVNSMKTSRSYKLFCITLLALGLQTYTVNNFAAEPELPEPVAQTALPSSTTDIIAQMIKNMIASSPWQKEAMTEVYRLSEHRLIWLNNKHTELALKLLTESPASKGLHSEDYNSQWLNTNWQQLKATPEPTFDQLALFDTTLSNSLLSYYSDLRYGRVNPRKVSFDFQVNKEHLKLALWTFNASQDGSLASLADGLEPKLIFYRNLKKALNQYQQAIREHKDIRFKLSGVTEDESHPQIVALRSLLTTLGDVISDKNSTNSNSETYDAALVAGVKNFQARHGLNANGVLNRETVAALNVPLVSRIAPMELSMERLRWIPAYTEDRLVLVNIPSFRLWAFDSLKDEKSKPLTMRVVVGKAAGTKTPSFSSKMEYVEFRPTWSVPQSIIRNEMMSKLENNPEYFAKRGMKVIYHNSGTISVRQASGDRNALGLVKFLFPNNHSVYFHDTPSKQYFNRDRRDFSHGCVRLAEPASMAEFALRRQKEEWTSEKVQKAMHKGGSKRITLVEPIPVIIFYGTALAINNNGVSFFQDVYGHDRVLKNALIKSREKGNGKKKV
jgi:murein L,D-transpeptidase YcbB/YkuD